MQYFINWKLCHHTNRKGMDWYWQIIDNKEIWSLWYTKLWMLPNCSHINTTVWRYLWCNSYVMLVMEPNVVWLLVTVLVVAILFVTTTLASDYLLCQILPCPRCVWKIYGGGGRHSSAGSSSDGQVIWVARLSSNSKNRENSLFNNNKKSFLLKHVCETNNKQTRFAFLANRRRKNIERGRVTIRCS